MRVQLMFLLSTFALQDKLNTKIARLIVTRAQLCCRHAKGDIVRVRLENASVRVRKPHLRTPGYMFGVVGVIERECVGMADNPEGLAFRQVHAKLPYMMFAEPD